MTRIHTLTDALSIWVYADHMPPHFHIRSPQSNALVSIASLQVIRGKCNRRDFAAVVAWASQPENLAAIEAEWSRLNEQD